MRFSSNIDETVTLIRQVLEPRRMSLEAEPPTMVISVGGAGFNILEKINELLQREKYDRDSFLLLAMDSRDIAELDYIEYWNEQKMKIDPTNIGDWETKQESYHYLDRSDGSPVGGGGVQRNRTAARTLLDNHQNFIKVKRNLKNKIESFDRQHANADGYDLWLVNALGGGTGSGTMPLMLGMAQLIESLTIDGDLNVHLLSTLPQLDYEDSAVEPELHPDATPNSFAALEELKELIDVTVSDSQSVPIRLEMDRSKVKLWEEEEGYSLKRGSIEDYYLLGVDEDKIGSDSYAEDIEKIGAITILTHSLADENFPRDQAGQFSNRILKSSDAVEYAFPYEDVATYARVKLQIETLERNQESLETVEDAYNKNRKLITAAINENSEHQAIAESVTYCRQHGPQLEDNKVEEFRYIADPDTIENTIRSAVKINEEDIPLREAFESVENELEEIDEEYRPESPTEFLASESEERREVAPDQYLLEFLSAKVLAEKVEQQKIEAEKAFEAAVKRLYEELEGEMSSNDKQNYDYYDDAEEKWEEFLKDFTGEHLENLREDGGFLGLFGDKEARADELEDDFIEPVEEAKSKMEDWRRTHELLEGNKNTRRGMLRELRDQYEEWVKTDISDEISRVERAISQKKTKEDDKEKALTNRESVERFRTIPVENPEELLVEYFEGGGKSFEEKVWQIIDNFEPEIEKETENIEESHHQITDAIVSYLEEKVNINELITSEIIDSDQLSDDLTDLLQRLEMRLVDQKHAEEGNAFIVPISHNDENWLEATGRNNYTDWLSGADRPFKVAEGAEVANVCCGTRGILRILLVNPDVKLKEMSEYQKIREWYDNGKLLDILDSDENNPEEFVNWAYPELANTTPTELDDSSTEATADITNRNE